MTFFNRVRAQWNTWAFCELKAREHPSTSTSKHHPYRVVDW